MNNELQQHKKSDTVKWILTLIAFILVGVMLIGIILGWFEKNEPQAENEEEQAQLAQNMIVSASSGRRMSLASVRAAVPSSEVLESVTITATVQPDNEAENTGVNWGIKWKNASSAWATGKTVTDYVTVTPSGDGYAESKTVTLNNLQPFGEQIVVTATSRDNPDVSASANVDYIQRTTDFSLSFGGVQCNFGGKTGVTVELNQNGTPTGGTANLSVVHSDVYTIAAQNEVEYSLSIANMYGEGNKAKESYWLERIGNMYGVYSYAQFFSYTEHGNYESVSYDTFLNFSVAEKGLYFWVPFMIENMGLTFSSGAMGAFPATKTNYTPTDLVELIAGPSQVEGSMIEFTNVAHDMFTLTVTVKIKHNGTEYGSIVKTTDFRMNNYTNLSPVNEMSVDRESVIF